MPVRVMHLLHRLTFGGTERVIVNLTKHSSPRVENFICGFLESDEDFIKEIPVDREHAFSLNKREGNDLSIPFKITSLCRLNHVHIIHSLGWATYAEGLLANKLFSNTSHFIHSFRGKTIGDTVHIPRRRILAQRIFSHFCDRIITNSEKSCKEYATLIGINPDRIRVIYNGVDTRRFQEKDKADVNNRKRQFCIKETDIVIGSVARFDPVKNLDGLLRAYSSVTESILKRTKLVLVGDGPNLNAVKTLVSERSLNGRVIFAGARSDIPECLNIMDIYVQPSLFENVPNAILEAMASGLPVIATDVGGVSEIVEKGTTGFLVTPKNEPGLAKSIEYLVENPDKRRDMGDLGKKRAASFFSIEKMVSDYEELYEDVLRRDK